MPLYTVRVLAFVLTFVRTKRILIYFVSVTAVIQQHNIQSNLGVMHR